MKKALIISTLLGAFLTSLARPIDLQTAESIAAKFMGANDLQLVSTYKTDDNTAAFYVFNTSDGFVIVAADDCETPIIAYSHEGRFDPENIPIQMQDHLQDFVERMQYGIENQIVANATTVKQWELVKATGHLSEQKNAKAVAPLLAELWHQGCRYNSLCPAMSGPCDHAEAGCVAVAMGQIMHYWGYPTTGWDAHSYTNAGTTLYADFGNTTYDWEHMPDSLTETSTEAEIEAVATLLFHCGVSVEMSYSANGSSTSTMVVPDALKHYFQYSRYLHRERKGSDNTEWLSKLKACLDQQCPILYSGRGNGSHAFVCDGYDENDLLHFNWGWGGNANGYFALGNLNPIGYDFNNDNSAILDIFPVCEPCHVVATAYPASAGTIEGAGEYHYNDYCTLTAVPSDNAKFVHWKKDGAILSTNLSYSFKVTDDVDGIEACFSFLEASQLSATEIPDANPPENHCVNLSWDYADTQWQLLKDFDIVEHDGVVPAGDFIYTYSTSSYGSAPARFAKYSMDGELLELFDIDGTNASSLTFDGSTFYCSDNSKAYYLYHLDFEQKRIIDSTYFPQPFFYCTYDAENDGFWILDCFEPSRVWLVNRQGDAIMAGPSVPRSYAKGIGRITAKDGKGHLLPADDIDLLNIVDWDIANSVLYTLPSDDIPNNFGTGYIGTVSYGQYAGKDACYVVRWSPNHRYYHVFIFEIKSQFEHIVGYRIYRADSEGHTVILADAVGDSSYTDSTWNEASEGLYRFGISSLYDNGTESEIVWSDYIENHSVGLTEHPQADESNVQKIIEDGHIVIIKDGKRYNVSGQRLN